jgi:probable rRNA maturation factor
LTLAITNRQRAVRFDLPRVRQLAASALPDCLTTPGPGHAPLPRLEGVSVAILSNAAIDRVHREFMGLQGPTDVITFPYGEILIGAGMARDNARAYGQSTTDEIALCIIHGLLHLNGYDDRDARSARIMRARQAQVLNTARQCV